MGVGVRVGVRVGVLVSVGVGVDVRVIEGVIVGVRVTEGVGKGGGSVGVRVGVAVIEGVGEGNIGRGIFDLPCAKLALKTYTPIYIIYALDSLIGSLLLGLRIISAANISSIATCILYIFSNGLFKIVFVISSLLPINIVIF